MSHHFKHQYMKKKQYSNFSNHPENTANDAPLNEEQESEQQPGATESVSDDQLNQANEKEVAQTPENQEADLEQQPCANAHP